MHFQSWGPNALIASREGVSLLPPFSPIIEGLITSIMLFSFTDGYLGGGGREARRVAGERRRREKKNYREGKSTQASTAEK